MKRSRLAVLGCVVVGMTVTGVFAQTTATEGSSSAGIAQEGPLESRTIESHMGGAIVQGGGGGGGGMGGGGGGMMMGGISTETPGPRVVVVPTSKVEPEAFTAIADDLQVMLHILRKDLTKGHGFVAGVFPDYGDLLGRDRTRLEGLYVQGYGAFLFTEVDLAQPAPSGEQAGQAQGKESATDPVWERAQQELGTRPGGARIGTSYSYTYSYPYGPSGYGGVPLPPGYGPYGASGYGGTPLPPGAPQNNGWESDELVKELIQVFKHASNIRHLDPSESVTLSVRGRTAGEVSYSFNGVILGATGQPVTRSTGASGIRVRHSTRRPAQGDAEQRPSSTAEPQGPPAPGDEQPACTVFTLQAKKSDIDQFARGQLPLDQFRQKVKVFTY